MHFSPEAAKELKQIAKEEYGRDLTEGEAGVIGMRLLQLYELIFRPLPSELRQQPSTPLPSDDRVQATPETDLPPSAISDRAAPTGFE